MSRFFLVILLTASLSIPARASQASAALVEKQYQTAMEAWTLQLRLAKTPEDRNAAIQQRPDAFKSAREMWTAIEPFLKEEWTLEPAAWFLHLTASLPAQKPDGTPATGFIAEAATIRKALETWHLASRQLAPMCMALTAGNDPRSLALLEKISTTHPDQKVQGVAALAAAIVMRSFGDNADVSAKRLTYIKKAIIQSADVPVDGSTVAKLAANEIYIIKFLTKGRIAPDLKGVDSADRALNLSDYKGKVIVLLFWNSGLQNSKLIVQFADSLAAKFKDDPFVMIGVNNDNLESLRWLQRQNLVKWPNFSDPENKLFAEYRIGSPPVAYVLDGGRKIHFAGPLSSFVELTADALLHPAAAAPAK